MTTPIDPERTPLRVELLGTGGYHPSERRHTACLLLPGLGLMLDAGTGAFRVHERLAGVALPGGRLDIVLTHAHLDHIAGLTFLIGLSDQNGPVETVVHAVPEVLAAIEEHLLASPLFPVRPVARFEPLGGSLGLNHGARLSHFPLDHPGGSIGLRIDTPDRSLAYVTDTRRPTAETIERLRGVDLLLHEAYFDDAYREFAAETGHCTASQAATVASEAGAGRLVMMHLNPRATEADEAVGLAEAREIFSNAAYGIDGQVIEL